MHIKRISSGLSHGYESLRQALLSADGGFNCLLLVAHGEEDPKNGEVNVVVGPEGNSHWYFLSELSENLQDKFLMLCVCYGFCTDVRSAFVSRDSLCLSVLAPMDSLDADEAEAFFPAFLGELNSSAKRSIDPNDIVRALKSTNSLSKGKMHLYSEGHSSPA